MSFGQFEHTFNVREQAGTAYTNGTNKDGKTNADRRWRWVSKLAGKCLHLQKDVTRHRRKRVTQKSKQCGAPNQVHQICSHFKAFAAVRADQFGWIEKLRTWDLDDIRALVPLTTKSRFKKFYPTLTLTHERFLFNSLFWYLFRVAPGMGRLVENVKWKTTV